MNKEKLQNQFYTADSGVSFLRNDIISLFSSFYYIPEKLPQIP